MASQALSLARLLRRRGSFTVVTAGFPGGTRRLYSSGTPPPDSVKKEYIRSTSSEWMMHPFLRDGRTVMHIAFEFEDRAVIKVDLPGIGKEGLNLDVKGDNIHFEGTEEESSDLGAGANEEVQPRRFYGILEMPPGMYNTGEVKGFMRDGVLKVVVPRLDGSKGLELPETGCTIGYFRRYPKKE